MANGLRKVRLSQMVTISFDGALFYINQVPCIVPDHWLIDKMFCSSTRDGGNLSRVRVSHY